MDNQPIATFRRLLQVSTAGAVIGAAAIAAGAARAQTTPPSAAQPKALETVVVTAERRSASVQKTAASLVAVSGNELLKQGVTQLDDAIRNVPGVTVSQGPTGLDPSIRGVGPSLPTNLGGDAGISVTFDGVYDNADITTRTGYYDLARIEVLRGPQGTLYGRNAEGGAVNFVTNNPTQKYEASLSAEIGNYNLTHFTAMANVPLTDDLAFRIAGDTVNRKGFLNNGQDDNVGSGTRAKLLYRPSEATSVLVGAQYTDVGGEGPGTVNAFTNSYSGGGNAWSNNDPSGQIYRDHGYKFWAQVDQDVGIGNLTFIPAYQWLANPQQFTFTGLNTADSTANSGALIQRSAELRLGSHAGDKITWVAGLYGYDYDQSSAGYSTSLVDGVITPNFSSGLTIRDSTARSGGAFAQVTVPIYDGLRLIGGLRYSDDHKSAVDTQNNATNSGSGSWTHLDYKAGLEYDVTPTSLAYLTVATGYRPGGISPAPPNPAFGEETLRSIEIGSKNQFLDNRLRVNVSLFDYDYTGYQLPDLYLTFVPVFQVNLAILNLPKVHEDGGELETQYLITEDDRVSFNLAYLDSKIESPVLISLPPPSVQIEGNALPNAPKFTLSGTYSHNFTLGNGALITPSVTARYVSDSYVTIPMNALTNQPSYWLVDGGVNYAPASDRWSLNAYIRNATDQVVKSNFVGTNMTLNSPRTYGLVFTAKF